VRLLSYNIRYGGAGRQDLIAAVIARCTPDIVILQEATRPALIEMVAEKTGMTQWRSYARQSLAFLSRRPVAHAAWHRPRFSRHAFIEVVPEGECVRVFGVHLSAVHAAWTERRRVMEMRALLRSIAQHEDGFHVLAGDFNTLAPGETLDVRRLPVRLRPFVWMSGGRIRWRTVQVVLDSGYVDAYRVQHALAPGHTFPSWDPHLRLDYVFTPAKYVDRVIACDVVADPEARAASDHLPVTADLRLE
jgi:exodeoxyribonuclease III